MNKLRTKRFSIVLVPIVALGVAGCGSDEAASDPRLETLSPAARDAFGAVITGSQPLRISTAEGSDFSLMGQIQDEQADLSKPRQMIEIDGDGEVHQVIAAVPAVNPSDPLESWRNSKEMIWKVPETYSVELSGASNVLSDAGANAQLFDSLVELLKPGEFRIDLEPVTDSRTISDKVGSQLVGNDVQAMFEGLAARFDAAEPVDGNENTRKLEITFGDMQGAEIAEDMMNSLLGGTDLPVDDAVMTDFIDDMMASPMSVLITLDADGRVERTESTIDMTEAMKSLMLATVAASGDAVPQDQIDSLVEGMKMEIIQLASIEYDDSIKVEMPSGVTEDRTDAFIAFGKAVDRASGADTGDTDVPDTSAAAESETTAAA